MVPAGVEAETHLPLRRFEAAGRSLATGNPVTRFTLVLGHFKVLEY